MTETVNADLVQTELIENQYRQARNNILSENTCLLFMIASALLHTDWRVVLGWAAVEIGTQIYRTIFMIRRYAAGYPKVNFADYWAKHHAIYQTSIGVVWGATAFLFAHADSPVSVAMTLCGLFVIASGAVPGVAYNPPALYGFVTTIFVLVVIRLIQFATFDYTILAVATVLYAGVLLLMGQLQTDVFTEGIRIRFENKQLVEELTVRTEEALAARASAEAASLAKSQFLAAASHDLRQPLYALSLLSGSLRARSQDEQAHNSVDQIQANVAALETLFNGLLDISRLEAGVIITRREPISIEELFDRLDRYFRPIAAERGLDLRLLANDLWVSSDPTLVEQMLANLISNAISATTKGGVLVAARTRGDEVLLQVWDTGRGLALADQARVFDEFVQIGNPERDRRRGMGLGLAIARRTSDLLGGGLAVQSQLGRGSIFSFRQPKTIPSQQIIDQVGAAPVDLIAGLSVLVVEDDLAVQHALAMSLQQWGADFAIAGAGDEALALLNSGKRYQVILSDYRLPGALNGLQLLAQLTAAHAAAPACCVITGDLDPEIIAAAAHAGIPLVHKPLNPSRLRALINHLATQAPAAA